LGEVLASFELSEEEVRGLRELVAKKVLENASGAFGAITASRTALAEKPYPAWAAVHVIGDTSGAIRITFIDPGGKWSDGLTLTYWLLEAARGPEGLKVKVAVEPSKKEGILFVIEGVVKTNG
jgi:hypothetical protein